jgi:response regulator RpfG family c-di-GMP phosphodiesterase
MLLTGQTDIQSAIAAVNDGQIFRFLTKPCSPEDLGKALDAALNQYRLIHAERELLEQTLRGSIQMLTDILSLTNPLAFGRAIRTKQRVAAIAQAMGVTERWHMEVAAMLSQIGAVTLPFAVADKVYHGRSLRPDEQYMVDRLPKVALRLTGRIPRLERVREAVRWQNERYDGVGAAAETPRGETIPLGARILKVAADFDAAESRGLTSKQIVLAMREEVGLYDPFVLNALAVTVGLPRQAMVIAPGQLREGMVFAEDVLAANNTLLIARGQEVTAGLLERLTNIASTIGPDARIKVYEDALVSALAAEGAGTSNAATDQPAAH